MGLFQVISEFFESIFKKSSPEVQKKQQLKKLEQEIRELSVSMVFCNQTLVKLFIQFTNTQNH